MKLIQYLEAQAISIINTQKRIRKATSQVDSINVCFHGHYHRPVFTLSNGDIKCTVELIGGQFIRIDCNESTGVECYLLAKQFELELNQQ